MGTCQAFRREPRVAITNALYRLSSAPLRFSRWIPLAALGSEDWGVGTPPLACGEASGGGVGPPP